MSVQELGLELGSESEPVLAMALELPSGRLMELALALT